MKLTRHFPSFDLGRVSDFDQWLRHPFASFPAVEQFLGELLPAGRLSADVFEDKDSYYARFELPGVKKEEIKVELHDRLLTVSANRDEKKENQENGFSLTRSISVPDGIRADAIGAKMEDGILTVTLPKQEHRKPKQIEVN